MCDESPMYMEIWRRIREEKKTRINAHGKCVVICDDVYVLYVCLCNMYY